MTYIEILGFVAAGVGTVSQVPQVIRTWKTRETKDLSLLMYIIMISGIILWFSYGILTDSKPIIYANIVTFVLASTMIYLKLRHG
jgi:MtN3 and saliva related transmembrane protein